MKKTLSEKMAYQLTKLILVVIGLATLIPFIYVIATSLAPETETLKYGMVLFPKTGFSLDAYLFILKRGSGIPQAYLVTVFVTTVGTALSLSITAMLAYGLSKRDIPGRKAFIVAIVFTMLFSGGLIPTFMVVKSIGLFNTIWAMIIPSLISAWNTLVMISFFEALPDSIEESARMDTSNEWHIFSRVIVPLSVPVLVTIGLFYAVGYWNQWFAAIMYINDRDKWPLQVLLRQVLIILDMTAVNANDMNLQPPPTISIKTATIVAATLPIMLIYPFIQKHFVKGVMIGALKG